MLKYLPNLDEEIYMNIPPRLKNKEYKKSSLQVKDILYGLKKFPRAWCSKLSGKLVTKGFNICTTDNSLFIKRNAKYMIIIASYVDDIIITDNNQHQIKYVKSMLKRYFDIKGLGKLRYFLGQEIAHSNKGIFLYQWKYMLDLKETGLIGTNGSDTPMETNIKLYLDKGEPAKYKSKSQRL